MVEPTLASARRRWLMTATAACVGGVAGLWARRASAAGPAADALQAATAQAAAASAAAARLPPAPALRVLDDLGVELTMLRLDASEFLIDLRYRVKDVAKAQPLLERKLHPVLVNEATGDRFYVPQAPKVGSLRQSATSKQPAIPGRVYFMLFANPDRKLKSGEKVTLYAGDSVVKDLTVQ
ncbi:MAG: hypothetical protein QM722_08550 [Piscinibacter sp.]